MGKLWCQWAAGFARDGQPPQTTVADMRQHLGQGGEQNLNFPAQQASQGLVAAAIRNVADIDLSPCFQQFALEMWKRSDTGRAEIQHAQAAISPG